MADLEKIVEDLSSLTVIEAADLSKLLEEKWGVSAAAPVAMAAASPADGGDAAAEEQTEFDVILASFGEKARPCGTCDNAIIRDTWTARRRFDAVAKTIGADA